MRFDSPQSSKNVESSNRQIITVIGFFSLVIIVFIVTLLFLSNNLVNLIPVSVEQKLGSLIVPLYEMQAQPSPVQTELNQLLDSLESHLNSDNKTNEYRVLYIPEDTVNALAIPGNRLVIYRGLLKKVRSENELMMILGHELGHFANRDHLRGLTNTLTIQILLSTLLPNIGIFQGTVAATVKAIANSQYSQSQEKQADEFGLKLLDKNYNHVAGATDFFAKLAQEKVSKYDFLSTHPAPQKRIKELEKMIRQSNYKIKKRSPLPESLKEL